MMYRHYLLGACLALLSWVAVATPGPVPYQAAPPSGGAGKPAVTGDSPAAQPHSPGSGDIKLQDARCIIGMEKFLPGEYFYCIGAQNYGLEHFDYSQKFFTEAASWASKPAQYVLGVMAFNGDHQPADHALGLAWMTLAAERGTARFTQPLAEYSAKATPAERAQSKALLADLSRTYADRVAAPRAELRYQQGMKGMRTTALAGTYCMAGQYDFRDLASGAAGGHCPPIEQVASYVDEHAGIVFEDWHGHVTVGDLEVVPPKDKPSP